MKRKYSGIEDLMKIAINEYDLFSLVFRGININNNYSSMEHELEFFIVKQEKTRYWPGSKILAYPNSVTIRYYKVCQESIKIISCVKSVFDFLPPNFPEDLCFYINELMVFYSCTHERDAGFISSDKEQSFRSFYKNRFL